MVNQRDTKSFLWSALLIAAGVLFASASYAVGGELAAWELRVFSAIYDLPDLIRPFMVVITQFGSVWMVLALAAGLLLMKKLRLSIYVLSVGFATYVVTELAKRLIDRPRPYALLSDVVAREHFVAGLGFPSGHTAVTTAIGLVLMKQLPRPWRPLIALWIGLVAFSRIYLGVHAPLDVIGGLALGTLIACLFLLTNERVVGWLKRASKMKKNKT